MNVVERETFLELVQRTRAGDDDAARQLVERYEPNIRRVIRIRLTDPSLRQTMDSMDVCQSVLCDFFVRVAMGQFELESPEHLIKLLSTMARNKVINHAKKQQAVRRDMRRNVKGDVGEMNVANEQSSPSSIVSRRELLDLVRQRLSPQEREIAELRASNTSWAQIAEKFGGTAESQRKSYARAVDRVSSELGLDEM